MTLRLAEPLVLTLLLAPAFFAPAAAADPSFDCRTAKTARELATLRRRQARRRRP